MSDVIDLSKPLMTRDGRQARNVMRDQNGNLTGETLWPNDGWQKDSWWADGRLAHAHEHPADLVYAKP